MYWVRKGKYAGLTTPNSCYQTSYIFEFINYIHVDDEGKQVNK